jgi:4,4'-diaponeurosporenoate glycosyltransferase
VISATAGLVLAGWVAGTLLLWRLPTPARSGAGVDPREVTVVIPARDEAHQLPGLLGDLAVQSVAPARIVVVDDGSTDGTAAVARAGGADVVDAGPLPEGWVGKPWACAAGVATATEVVVLLDADVRVVPEALDRLLAEHEQRAPEGLLSVQPFHQVGSVVEHASLLPSVVAIMASGIAEPRPADRPGLAFGPCLVTTRTALAAAGGYQAIRGELLEDAALARRMEAVGRPVAVLGGGSTVSFRMFRTPADVVHGWTRILAGGAAGARFLACTGAVLWVAALVAVVLCLVHPTAIVGGAYAVSALQVGWASRRVGSFHPLSWVFFPVPLVAFVVLFAGSIVQRLRGRPARWHGRAVARPSR